MSYVPIRDFNAIDFPPRRRRRRHIGLALVILWALAQWAVLLVGIARAEDEPRYEPASRSPRQVVQELAEAHFPPGTAAYATRIAYCESTWNPNADTNPPYIGLWQIDPHLHGWRIVAIYGHWRSLYEPEVNAAVAAHILADQGWGAWPVCSK